MIRPPKKTPSELDILCYRYRHTMLPVLRSFLGDRKTTEVIRLFAGLSFRVPPIHEQDRAALKSEVMAAESSRSFASDSGRPMDAAEAEEVLERLREKWKYQGSAWRSFIRAVKIAEPDVTAHAAGVRNALAESPSSPPAESTRERTAPVLQSVPVPADAPAKTG